MVYKKFRSDKLAHVYDIMARFLVRHTDCISIGEPAREFNKKFN